MMYLQSACNTYPIYVYNDQEDIEQSKANKVGVKLDDITDKPLVGEELIFLRTLLDHKNEFVSYKHITENLRWYDPDGGPVDEDGYIRILATRIRKKLKSGFIIKSNQQRCFRLEYQDRDCLGAIREQKVHEERQLK